jgi:eukaryotic-like serine/threonine-protein kinase
MEGQTVSHYRVLERLGGGGMGVVYKAIDQRLDRPVALKFLPPDLTRDDEAKTRFVQEAKAASALEHTNIGTIHEIGESADGQLFLALAFYDGETLKKRIERGPLPVADAIDITLKIASGLAVAHESRILHRDIKPANVMLTRRGEVKVVDFGLAKLVGQAALTRTGVTLGTVPYMSPEQLRGEEVDERTDIWSLGVVLYEMITGQRPFKGDEPIAASTAILNNLPAPVSSLRTGVPLEIERVIDRALAKRADERYQTMNDLIAELRQIHRRLEGHSTTVPIAAARTPRRNRLIWGLASVVFLFVAAALTWYTNTRTAPTLAGVARLSNAMQVTSAVGAEEFPTWSPEGDRLAYTTGPNSDVWVTQVSGGQPVNRTADFSGPDSFPSWSPDGRQIAFWSARKPAGVYVMAAVGGTPRLVTAAPNTAGRPQWSRDGSRLAYLTRDESGPSIQITSLQDGSSQRVALPARTFGGRYELSWSPDERLFAYVDGTDLLLADVTQIWLLRASDQKTVALTAGRTKDISPSWSPDGRHVFFISNRAGSMDLWQQAIAGDGSLIGEAQPVTAGVGMRRAVVSPDGRKLAYSKGARLANIWKVPILPDRQATWADARQITSDEAYIEHIDLSPDGRRLVVSSNRSGNPDLWLLSADGGEMQQLTVDPTPDWYPRWSPDGSQIAFYAYRSGFRNLWIMPAAGGPARQLTKTEYTDWYPAWSPDGRHVAFRSNRNGVSEMWVVDRDGGEPRPLATFSPSEGYVPEWRDDEHIITRSRQQWWTLSLSGRAPEPFWQTAGPVGGFLRFSPDRQQFVYRRAGGPQHWSMGVKDGRERQITNLEGRAGQLDTAIATDGEFLYFGWTDERGDLWVMDVAR